MGGQLAADPQAPALGAADGMIPSFVALGTGHGRQRTPNIGSERRLGKLGGAPLPRAKIPC